MRYTYRSAGLDEEEVPSDEKERDQGTNRASSLPGEHVPTESQTVRGYFITGTDTGVGKTLIACALVRSLVHSGYRVAVMKPVAAGCTRTADGLRNDDALALMAEANVKNPYSTVNPYAFEPPIAPHIAAAEAGIIIDPGRLATGFAGLEHGADQIVVEGAGGWDVPLTDHATLADLAADLGLPVVLVVGLRLGCLNHALLTARAIVERDLRLGGWVANTIDTGFAKRKANIETLERRLDAPLLGVVPALSAPEPSEVLRHLDFECLA